MIGYYIFFGFLLFIIVFFGCLSAVLKNNERYKLKIKDKHDEALVKKVEKEKYKWKRPKLDNPILLSLWQFYMIMFQGGLGSGKSFSSFFLARWFLKKRELDDKKFYRYNKYMNPNYIAENERMEKNNLLPLFCDIEAGYIKNGELQNSQELESRLRAYKKFPQKSVAILEEIGLKNGKEIYNQKQNQKQNQVLDTKKQIFRFARQDTETHFIANEQDGNNLFIGFRRTGFKIITCKGCWHKLHPFGKFLKFIFNFIRKTLPAYFTINVKKELQQTLVFVDRIKLLFALFLPSYYSTPLTYYIQQTNFSNLVAHLFTTHYVKWESDKKEFVFALKDSDLFKYDTHQHRSEYEKLFDKKGDRLFTEIEEEVVE